MTLHSEHPSRKLVDKRDATAQNAGDFESSTEGVVGFSGRLLYLWSLLVAALLLLVVALPLILVAWAIRRHKWFYPVAVRGVRVWLRLSGMRVSVEGSERLNPSRTYVLIANHRSYLDPAALFARLDRRLGFIAKKELLRVPVLGQGMGYANAMAIDRSNRTRAIQTMQEASERLHSGVSFIVFAEGTRAGAGELLPFKKGGFYMAIEAGAAIAPVAIKNTDALMGKKTGHARPGTIEVVILPPVETEGLVADRDVDDLMENVRSKIAAELSTDVVPMGEEKRG